MTKRLTTYLPDGVYDFLEKWADEERRSVSNLAAVLLELLVRDRENWKPKIESTSLKKDEEFR